MSANSWPVVVTAKRAHHNTAKSIGCSKSANHIFEAPLKCPYAPPWNQQLLLWRRDQGLCVKRQVALSIDRVMAGRHMLAYNVSNIPGSFSSSS
jgi:hypothetical protein